MQPLVIATNRLKHRKKCRLCHESVKPGNIGVFLHKVGELPSTFHPTCALDLAGALVDAGNREEFYKEFDLMPVNVAGTRNKK